MVTGAGRHERCSRNFRQHRLHGERISAAENNLDEGWRRAAGQQLADLAGPSKRPPEGAKVARPTGRLGECNGPLGSPFSPNRQTWQRKTKLTHPSNGQKRAIVSSPHLQVYENGSLNILEARDSDLGHYMCQATNGVGPGLSKVIRVTINGKRIGKHKTYLTRAPLRPHSSLPSPPTSWPRKRRTIFRGDQ